MQTAEDIASEQLTKLEVENKWVDWEQVITS